MGLLNAASFSADAQTTINGSTVNMTQAGQLGTGNVVIRNGGTLNLDFGTFLGTSTAGFNNLTIETGTVALQGSMWSSTHLRGSLTVNGQATVQSNGANLGYWPSWRDVSIDGPVSINRGAILTAVASDNNTVTFGGSASRMTLAAGASLRTSGAGTVVFGSDSARTIVGQGSTSQESRLVLGATNHEAHTGTRLEVNGSGTGGLRVEGASTRVNSLLTDERLSTTTGSGGTLTLAYTNNDSRVIGSAANLATPSNVRIGLFSDGGSFTLGTAGGTTRDLANWAGLVVGDNTTVTFADNNVFSNTASLSMLGGTLALGGTTQSFGELNVSHDSIIDFGTSASELNLSSLSIADGVILTVLNWTKSVDYFTSTLNPGAENLSRIVFSSYPPGNTHWQSWDKQITPVPEPATYGALMIGAALATWMRRRRRERRLEAKG